MESFTIKINRNKEYASLLKQQKKIIENQNNNVEHIRRTLRGKISSADQIAERLKNIENRLREEATGLEAYGRTLEMIVGQYEKSEKLICGVSVTAPTISNLETIFQDTDTAEKKNWENRVDDMILWDKERPLYVASGYREFMQSTAPADGAPDTAHEAFAWIAGLLRLCGLGTEADMMDNTEKERQGIIKNDREMEEEGRRGNEGFIKDAAKDDMIEGTWLEKLGRALGLIKDPVGTGTQEFIDGFYND